MTATVDSTPALPEPQAQPNAPILTTDGNQGGLLYTARSINTAYEKARTQLVAQFAEEQQAMIVDDLVATTRLRWRVKTLGNSGGEVSTETLNGWVALNWEASMGSPAATVTATVTGASTTETQSVTYSTDTVGGIEWLQFPDFDVDDDQEYLDIELGITVNTDMVEVSIFGAAFFYECSRSALVAAAYSSGFTPVHNEAVDENSPCATFALYDMHAGALHIYQTRQGGNLIADALVGISSSTPVTKIYDVWIPPGVTEVRGWFYCSGSASLSDDIDVSLGATSSTINRGAGLNAWVSVDFDVEAYQGTWQELTVTCTGAACSVSSVSAYARDIS